MKILEQSLFTTKGFGRDEFYGEENDRPFSDY